MTTEQIIEVGKVLLPYLREDIAPEVLGQIAHDTAVAARRPHGANGLSDTQRLAIACGNVPYEDDKVCPQCSGRGYVSAI